jgi:hypothetical protein
MSSNNRNENAEEHSKNKWYHHKPTKLTIAVAMLVIYGYFIFVDAHDVWPWSPVFALVAGVTVTIALLYAEAFATEAIGFRSFLVSSMIVFVGGIAIYFLVPYEPVKKMPPTIQNPPTPPVVITIPAPPPAPPAPPTEIEQEGTLQPGDDPTPPNPCDTMHPEHASQGTRILIGDNSIWTPFSKFTALRVGHCDVVGIEQTRQGAKIDASLYDVWGDLIARITDGDFHVLTGKNVNLSRRGDLSILVITDAAGKELLYVHYLNRTTFRIRGFFGCPGHAIVAIQDGPIAGSFFSESCFAGAFGGLAIR